MSQFTVQLPQIPKQEYSIIEYGAISGGIVSNTKAINEAITAASCRGGGIVIVPAGIWLSGPITLQSNINLHLEKGALLLFDKNQEEYPLILADWEGQPRIRAVSPIHAHHAENIAITGDGIIDGNGQEWRLIKEFKLTKKQWEQRLKKSLYVVETKEGGIWFPSKTSYDGCMAGEPSLDDPKALEIASAFYDYYRPVLVNFVHCNKVLIEGVTLQNSPAWNVHPLFCTNVTIRNASIRNDWFAQNGDGLDLESCSYVDIDHVSFDVGDDAICMKSGKDAIGRAVSDVPTEHVRIHDCVVYHGHGGFVVGSEMSRGIKDVTVENCLFLGTDTGIRFKSAIGRGGVVEDIVIRNVSMTDIAEDAFIFTMGYSLYKMDHQSSETAAVISNEDIPEFKNITMEQITCRNAGSAITINGLEELPIHDLTFKDVTVLAKKGLEQRNAENIRFEHVTIRNQKNPDEVITLNETVNGEIVKDFK